jgi:prepilin-type N-terminal cleavage/methylation domain-containing protein
METSKMKRVVKSKVLGFTLVELLIVVAIIGVLATIGVPTFRKMVQKAKKSEAKVALGALYTSETAFFSEYGAYGNNIKAIGFELEGQALNRVYHTGFVLASCTAVSAVIPASGTTVYDALSLAFPAYYSTANFATAFPAGAPGAPTAGCFASDAGANGTSFIASSSGMVSPRTGAPVDQWTMDSTRSLANVQDGLY